jgi:hypothetical protein
MTAVLLLMVAVLAIGEFLLFGALAEAYRDVRQLREFSGALDDSMPVDLGEARDTAPSSNGLSTDLDFAVRAVVVFLDSHCGTCKLIVDSLNGGIPKGIWLVAVAESVEAAHDWLAASGIKPSSPAMDRVTVMLPGEVEQKFGIRITPLAIEIENGRLTRARTVPSIRRFYALVPTTIVLEKPIAEVVST